MSCSNHNVTIPKYLMVLLLLLAVGSAVPVAPALATDGDSRAYMPDAGGSGYGDPDDPQGSPKVISGGDPEYSVGGSGSGGTLPWSGFGRQRFLGHNSGLPWMWQLRVLAAGLRVQYLRF